MDRLPDVIVYDHVMAYLELRDVLGIADMVDLDKMQPVLRNMVCHHANRFYRESECHRNHHTDQNEIFFVIYLVLSRMKTGSYTMNRVRTICRFFEDIRNHRCWRDWEVLLISEQRCWRKTTVLWCHFRSLYETNAT